VSSMMQQIRVSKKQIVCGVLSWACFHLAFEARVIKAR
jgi:hypothetical protein